MHTFTVSNFKFWHWRHTAEFSSGCICWRIFCKV